MRHEVLLLLVASLLLVGGCREARERSARPAADNTPDAALPWSPRVRAPTPPQGMVWVPEGALIAGTPPDRLPRIADEEMPGLQVVLRGFFIDVFAYPNEEGAIPQTGATHAEAEHRCNERGKRLCTELEWERACKGPRNFTYEYGDRYRAEACWTGKTSRMLPSGYRQGCRSEFGVRDMHGGVWEWTASAWGRGTDRGLFSLRGGNSATGELVGRCANASARAPESTSAQVGFRCCEGPVNEASVSLHIERGPVIDQRGRVEPEVTRTLERLLPGDVRQTLLEFGPWRVSGVWDWRPIGNVELVVGGGCAGVSPTRRCGAVIAQLTPGVPQLVAWVPVGLFPPVPRFNGEPRRLWLYGGDRVSRFRQGVEFEWGRVRLGEVVRNTPPKHK